LILRILELFFLALIMGKRETDTLAADRNVQARGCPQLTTSLDVLTIFERVSF